MARQALRKAIADMESARATTSTLNELRAWRLEASKRFVARALMAAPKKGAGK